MTLPDPFSKIIIIRIFMDNLLVEDHHVIIFHFFSFFFILTFVYETIAT